LLWLVCRVQDAAVTDQAVSREAPQLRLLTRIRYPIPGSFYDREEDFKLDMTSSAKTEDESQTMDPRTSGSCKLLPRGKQRAAREVFCVLTGNQMHAYAADSPDADPCDGGAGAWKRLELVGAHLSGGKAAEEFSISTADGELWLFIAPTAQQRNEWMVALGKVPGLFRCAVVCGGVLVLWCAVVCCAPLGCVVSSMSGATRQGGRHAGTQCASWAPWARVHCGQTFLDSAPHVPCSHAPAACMCMCSCAHVLMCPPPSSASRAQACGGLLHCGQVLRAWRDVRGA
jgi:hypothetical protein